MMVALLHCDLGLLDLKLRKPVFCHRRGSVGSWFAREVAPLGRYCSNY